ncbi:MAG: transposase [Gammaproteobacteria bacterium]|nr:transposase [Gammaproteobacteria bacterium]
MSKRGKKYTADFKTKVILELLEGEQTLNQICSKHEVIPKKVKEWKATFLVNASLAFNVEKAVSGYKHTINVKEKEINQLHRQLGKRTAELEWASKKLKSLGYNERKTLIESKLDNMSVVKQCELLGLNRSSFYYESKVDHEPKLKLLKLDFSHLCG